MIARYKKSLLQLVELLRKLELDPDKLQLLLELQRKIISRIRATERRLYVLKECRREISKSRKTSRPSKDDSVRMKNEIEVLDGKMRDVRRMLWVWRSFGDGIAFIYLDKYSLKHMIYNTHEYTVKQTAGSLSGKVGMKAEWGIVRKLLKNEVPAVLCDITNVLRHGDVCVLVGPDPMPIEVKSGSGLGPRAERQIASLTSLRGFFETDEATNFRGLKQIKRVALKARGTSHAALMNECIQASKVNGLAYASPEPGLGYVCIRPPLRHLDRLAQYVRAESIVVLLDDIMSNDEWMAYYPFVLSIRAADQLIDFLDGKIILAVVLDTRAVIEMFKEKGLAAQFVEHPQWMLVACPLGTVPGDGVYTASSKQFFGRLFYDFDSLAHYVQVVEAHLAEVKATFKETDERISAGDMSVADLDTAPFPPLIPMKWSTPTTL